MAPAALLAMVLLGGCDERFCSDAGVCWADRQDVVAAAERCGIANFEPRQTGQSWLPYVAGEDPDKGLKTNCIVDDLKGQGLMVTH